MPRQPAFRVTHLSCCKKCACCESAILLVPFTDHPFFALQAANVLDRLGEAARPALPAMKRVNAKDYLQRILEHAITVLEARQPD